MSSISVTHSIINGTIQAPSSKSYAQRAAVLALLKGGKVVLNNYGNSNDELVVLQAIQSFGANVIFESDKIIVDSNFKETSLAKEINVGESGLGLRLLTFVAALLNDEIVINGKGSLLNRPNQFFNEVLPLLGVEFNSNDYKLPFTIKGAMQLKDVEIDGSISSQFLSGLLIAFSYLYKKNNHQQAITIKVNNLKSKPYVDVTLDALHDFGFIVPKNVNYEYFVFDNDNLIKASDEYFVEGDWSSIATMLVAAAIGGSITIENVNANSKQADKKIVEVLESCGCEIFFSANKVSLKKAEKELKAFDFDATDCPDLFPILVALATHCNGSSTIKGVNRLLHKESNRGKVLQHEFAKLGIQILIEGDMMSITKPSKILSATISSNNDHRIAFAGILVALQSAETITITDVEAINKSYKSFIEDLKKVGANVSSL